LLIVSTLYRCVESTSLIVASRVSKSVFSPLQRYAGGGGESKR
jgi:hypothetical protein